MRIHKMGNMTRGLLVLGSVVSLVVGGASVTNQASAASKKVAFSQANFGNGWYEVQADGVKAKMKKKGYDLTVLSAGGKPVTQISQIRNFITQRVDGVILNPTDPLGLGASLKNLKKAKIPVVLVNTSVDKSLSRYVYCYVAENEVTNAAAIGVAMANALKAKYGSTTIKAVIIKGFPGDANSTRRDTGFHQGYKSVAGAPTLDLLPDIFGEFNAQAAIEPVRSVSTANPDLKAIFTVTDSMLPAIETALKGADMWTKVTIGSYDARMSVVKQMMDDPTGPIVATVANHPFIQGTIGSNMLAKAMKGVPKSKACPGGNYYLKPTVVTPANAAKYYKADVPY